MSTKFKKVPVRLGVFGAAGGNYILHITKKSYISYQPFTEGGRGELLEAINEGITGDTRRTDETALYDGKTWRILWGDWRKDYQKLAPKGVKACIKFYESMKPEHGCDKWSTDW